MQYHGRNWRNSSIFVICDHYGCRNIRNFDRICNYRYWYIYRCRGNAGSCDSVYCESDPQEKAQFGMTKLKIQGESVKYLNSSVRKDAKGLTKINRQPSKFASQKTKKKALEIASQSQFWYECS